MDALRHDPDYQALLSALRRQMPSQIDRLTIWLDRDEREDRNAREEG
jgi:hypothetical protein